MYWVVAITADPNNPDKGISQSIPFIVKTEVEGYNLTGEQSVKDWVRDWLTSTGLYVVELIVQPYDG